MEATRQRAPWRTWAGRLAVVLAVGLLGRELWQKQQAQPTTIRLVLGDAPGQVALLRGEVLAGVGAEPLATFEVTQPGLRESGKIRVVVPAAGAVVQSHLVWCPACADGAALAEAVRTRQGLRNVTVEAKLEARPGGVQVLDLSGKLAALTHP